MKNNNIKGISLALIWENLKLGWYVPLLSAILYFLSGIFPIITNYSNLDEEAWFIENSLINHNIGYVLLLIAVPLISAMLVMSYLHNPVKSLTLHSQPYTKAKLFGSHIISGYIMCIIPILLNTVFYFIFLKEAYKIDINDALINVYTAKAIITWLLGSLSLMTYCYGLFVLAGALSGNMFMHLALSGVFFFIVPVIIFALNFYFDTFISGFNSLPENVLDFMVNVNPLLNIVIASAKGIGPAKDLYAVYLIAGIVFILLGFAAYKKAKLEKVGDSFFFKTIEEIMTYLVVFVGMTIFGSLFGLTKQSRSLFAIGLIVGTLVCFLIAKIIIERSAKVFSKRNLKSLLIYIMLAGSFVAFTVFDVAGIANRVPQASEIESIEYADFIHGLYSEDYSVRHINKTEKENAEDYMISDETFLENATELHRYICEHDRNTNRFGFTNFEDELPYQSLYFNYKLKNDNNLSRTYGIRVNEETAKLIDKLTKNENFKKLNTYSNKINWDSEMYMIISDSNYPSEKSIKDKSSIKKFIETLDEDIYNKSYMEYYHKQLENLEPISSDQKTEYFYGADIHKETAQTSQNNTLYVQIVFESGIYDDERIEISLYSSDLMAYKYIRELYENKK